MVMRGKRHFNLDNVAVFQHVKKASSVAKRSRVGLVARLWDYFSRLAGEKGKREEAN